MTKTLPVRIYPDDVMIDGMVIKRDEFKQTMREMYQGFEFRITFT